jgi:hypothetical protein
MCEHDQSASSCGAPSASIELRHALGGSFDATLAATLTSYLRALFPQQPLRG